MLSFLSKHKLDPATYMPYLNELGAASMADLHFVEIADVKELNMKAIPRNKLLAALATLDGGKDEL